MQLILSVLSDDKPGVVREIANVATSHGARWLDSQLGRLCGKFAGVIAVEVAEARSEALVQALARLQERSIRVLAEPLVQAPSDRLTQLAFEASAADRNGLVLELSQAIADRGMNVLQLHTQCTSMPYSGDPLFSAEGIVELPQGMAVEGACEALEQVAAELGMDFSIEEVEG